MTQARVLHKCKQRHGWIEHNNIYKTSLLIMLKRGMDHSVAARIHGISATLRELLCMLVLVTTEITKIYGIYPVKMAWHTSKLM